MEIKSNKNFSTPNNQDTQIVYPAPKNNVKPVLVAVIILLLLIIIGGGVLIMSESLHIPKLASDVPTQSTANYFSNSSAGKALLDLSPVDETANWKTYTNVEYRYLFKYPPELLTVGSDNHLKIIENDPSQKVQTGITFDIMPQNTGVVKISDPVGTRKEIAKGLIEEKVSEKILGGLVAAAYLLEASPSIAHGTLVPQSQVRVKVPRTAKLLQISLYDLAHIRDGKEIFDQILSTFKFL